MKKLLLIITIFISLISQAQVNVTVDYQPLMDRLDSIEQRLKSAGSGGGYDLTYIEHDIADIKQRLSIIENYNVDYSAPIGELYDAVNEINEKVNNLPTRTDTVYIVGEGGEQPDYSQDITDLKYMVAALADRVNSISTGTTGDVTGLPYAAASLGLKAGYDITDELNNLNAPLVLFDGGAYLISGDVDAKGATYMFRPGSRIAGRGTIKNVKIDAGDYQIFDLHIDLRNASTTGDRVWWTWWGAKADDPDFDNTPYLQQGIDMVIANPTLPRRFYGNPGTYHTQNGLVVYKWDGTDYRFCDIVIEGDPETWKSSEEYGTWIWNHNVRSFGINFQRVRSSALWNVGVRGDAKYADHYGGYAGMFGSDFERFTEVYNRAEGKDVLDTRFAMYAGVVVDAFANGPAYNGTWPGWEHWNRGTGQTGGASALRLDGVYLWNFTINLALSPSGTTYNAEDISMDRVYFRSSKIAISIGQDQNKNIQLNNFVAYQVHTIFDGVTYGKGIGAQIVASNGDMANCNRLVNISSQRFPWVFNNLFTEEFYRIGDIDHGAMPVVFNNLQFEYVGNSDRISAMPSNILKGNNVVFNGGYIRTPHAPTFTRPVFQGKDISFNQITLENAPIFPGTIETTNGNQNGYFHQVNLLAWESRLGGTSVGSQNLEPFRNYPLYGQFTVSSQMLYPNASVKFKYDETKYDHSYRLGSGTVSAISKSQATLKLQFGADYYPVYALDINDHIITQTQDGVQALGRITSINLETLELELTDVPDNITPGEYTIWGNYIRRVQRPFAGDISKGSNVITNIKSPFGYPSAGDRIETYVDFSTTSIPVYIKSVNEAERTVTVSRNMLTSESDVPFAMGDPVIEIHSIAAPTDAMFHDKYMLRGTRVKTGSKEVFKVTNGGTKETATYMLVH